MISNNNTQSGLGIDERGNGVAWESYDRGYPLRLTHRQVEVLALLCEGLPNKLIARRLQIAAATVKTHVSSVFRALNVSTRLEAVVAAQHLGIAGPAEMRGTLSGVGGALQHSGAGDPGLRAGGGEAGPGAAMQAISARGR